MAQIQENSYLQFFIGLPGYQKEKPFDSSINGLFSQAIDTEVYFVVRRLLNGGVSQITS